MGQILHGCARTTETVRRAIQQSQESLRVPSGRHGIKQKTVAKWRERTRVQDAPMEPRQPRSTVLSKEEEAACVAFRQQTLLPLDDGLYSLQTAMPQLTRSSLHRCYQRHGISRLPKTKDPRKKRKFKTCPIGFFHIDIAEVRTEEGKLYLFAAIDRTSKFAFVQLHEKATRRTAAGFLRDLIAAVPYTIHTVLTDNGTRFTTPGNRRSAASDVKQAIDSGSLFRAHAFELACALNGLDHRLTKPKHPWANGQVERMNRTLKEAAVKRCHYGTHDQLQEHLQTFLMAYNFARRLKTLRGLTPYESICNIRTSDPARFTVDPFQHTVGLNI